MNIPELDLIILKHIIISKRNAIEFLQIGSDKIFSPDLWKMAKQVLDYVKVYREVPTKKVLIERATFAKNTALITYIETVWNALDKVNVDEKEFRHDLEKLQTKYTEQLIYSLKDKLFQGEGRIDLKKSINDLNIITNTIKSVGISKPYTQITLKEGIKELRESYMAKLKNPKHGAGIKIGYSFFDFVSAGIMTGETMLIGAETNGGKSMLLSNIAYNMWMGENNIDTVSNFKEGADIIYFSLEMPYRDCQQRLLARLAMVPETSIRDATLTKEEGERLNRASKFIANYPHEFTIVDIARGATMEQIELIFNDTVMKLNKKPQVLVIDYLTLMDCPDEEQDWLKTGRLSEQLHSLTRTLEVVGLTATQLNRAKQGPNGATGVDRIARSSLQAANANFVLIIDKRQNEKDLPDFKLSLVKNRRGALVDGRLYKKLDCCALLEKPDDSSILMNDASDISNELDSIN